MLDNQPAACDPMTVIAASIRQHRDQIRGIGTMSAARSTQLYTVDCLARDIATAVSKRDNTFSPAGFLSQCGIT